MVTGVIHDDCVLIVPEADIVDSDRGATLPNFCFARGGLISVVPSVGNIQLQSSNRSHPPIYASDPLLEPQPSQHKRTRALPTLEERTPPFFSLPSPSFCTPVAKQVSMSMDTACPRPHLHTPTTRADHIDFLDAVEACMLTLCAGSLLLHLNRATQSRNRPHKRVNRVHTCPLHSIDRAGGPDSPWVRPTRGDPRATPTDRRRSQRPRTPKPRIDELSKTMTTVTDTQHSPPMH